MPQTAQQGAAEMQGFPKNIGQCFKNESSRCENSFSCFFFLFFFKIITRFDIVKCHGSKSGFSSAQFEYPCGSGWSVGWLCLLGALLSRAWNPARWQIPNDMAVEARKDSYHHWGVYSDLPPHAFISRTLPSTTFVNITPSAKSSLTWCSTRSENWCFFFRAHFLYRIWNLTRVLLEWLYFLILKLLLVAHTYTIKY